jgi:hypothetical protein
MSFLTWTPWAIPGLVTFFGGLGLAWFVYRSRPDRAQNRLLALQLVCEAIVIGFIGGAQWVIADARVVAALHLTALFVVWPKLWTYYSFLATLDTPLARPLTPRVLRWFLVATLLAGTTVFIRPDWYAAGTGYWPAVRALHTVPGSAFIPILWMWALMWIVGLAFSISALRHARTEIRRAQARAYLVAFGFRDICFLLTALLFTLMAPTHQYFHLAFLIAFPITWTLYYPLVAWGILQHQLFGIELLVKRGVQRSVVGGAITGAFFIGAYALEQYVQVNSFLVGLVAAACVTAAIQPLQRFAARLADRLLPGVDSSEAYLMERKHEVFRNALEAAMQDGTVTERERAILTGLEHSLGVSAGEAAAIEASVRFALHPAARVLAPA